eukprot:12889482-Prorocentrum_lima.AAC.1
MLLLITVAITRCRHISLLPSLSFPTPAPSILNPRAICVHPTLCYPKLAGRHAIGYHLITVDIDARSTKH